MKKIYLALFLRSFVLTAQVPPGADGFWPFDGNAQDMSGNNSHGVINNAVNTSNRFGQPNKALKFDGVSSNVLVQNNAFVDVANNTDFSISYWQKIYPGNANASVISKQVGGSWNGYDITVGNTSDPGYCNSAGHMYFYSASSAQQDACSDAPVMFDTIWRCIVVVHDANANQSFLYINGVQQQDIGSSAGNLSNPASLSFGFHGNINGRYFKGALDNVRLYKRVLTQTEITQLCNETECLAPDAPTNVTSSNNKIICMNTSAVLKATGSGTISWFSSPTSTVAITTGSTFITLPLSAGNYTFYAQANTCQTSSLTAITVSVSECIGIHNNIATPAMFDVYPNPGKGSFILKSDQFTKRTALNIRNQLGMLVFSQKINTQEMFVETNLPAGVYYLSISDERSLLFTKKLVIH